MKIIEDHNNSSEDKLLINQFKNKRLKSNLFFEQEGMKKSSDLLELNGNNFNISNAPYNSYTAFHKSPNIKNLKGKAISNIVLNNDESERSYENITSYTNQNLKQIKSNNHDKTGNNASSISNIPKPKTKKRVKVNPNFTNIIEIESYKKYNINDYLYNKTNCVNCSCEII